MAVKVKDGPVETLSKIIDQDVIVESLRKQVEELNIKLSASHENAKLLQMEVEAHLATINSYQKGLQEIAGHVERSKQTTLEAAEALEVLASQRISAMASESQSMELQQFNARRMLEIAGQLKSLIN